MSNKLARIAGMCAVLAATPALAQESLQQELARLKDQMQQMMSAYQRQIEALENRLTAMEAKPPSQTPPAPSAPAVPPPAPAPTPTAAQNAFNPQISMVLDGKYSAYGKNPNSYTLPGFALGDEAGPAPRGFALGESEIGLSSNVDQWLYANAVVSFSRDGAVNVEEAYAQTTSLPWGFTAKAGRFFSGFGYLNSQHAHTWDFADAPLPYAAFLNGQYGDDGIEARWLAPTDFFLEFGGELARGDAFPAGGAANRGVGAWNAFVHIGDDINEASSYRVGAGFLRTLAHDRDSDGGANLFTGHSGTGVLDAVYKWAPGGNPVETNLARSTTRTIPACSTAGTRRRCTSSCRAGAWACATTGCGPKRRRRCSPARRWITKATSRTGIRRWSTTRPASLAASGSSSTATNRARPTSITR
jgi:hypothetical protein